MAGKLAEHVSAAAPFYLGAGMTAISVVVLRPRPVRSDARSTGAVR